MRKEAPILTERTFRKRRLQLRLLVAASTLPLFGMVAAFGFAPKDPQQEEDLPQIEKVVTALTLPDAPALAQGSGDYWLAERVRPGDTLGELLGRLDITPQEISLLLSQIQEMPLLRQIRPGKTLEAKVSKDHRLLALRYVVSDESSLQIQRVGEDLFRVLNQEPALAYGTETKAAVIDNSLFGATDDAGIPDSIALQLAEIFSSEIDFHLDLRKGDRFSVVYETYRDGGQLLRTGRILAAEFVNQGHTYTALSYTSPDGTTGYYTPDGKNLKKAFLRSPLAFTRISSGFTLARYHPILKKWRAHKGVDYAAPTGTDVHATADGVVEFEGVKHGYGNVVILRHAGGFSTVYGHLSGFAQGLHRGDKVTQNQLIAYVGMTGLATGPHLHYEFRVNDEPKDPLSVAVPVAFPLPKKYQASFSASTKPLFAKLDLVRGLRFTELD